MRDRHVGDIVAVEESADGKIHPRGVLTDRDIVLAVLTREVDAFGLFVGDVMSSPPAVAYDSEDMWQVVKRMRLHAIRRMPVVSNTGGLVGLLSFDDLLVATLAGNAYRQIRESPKGIAAVLAIEPVVKFPHLRTRDRHPQIHGVAVTDLIGLVLRVGVQQ